jgi:hypothetical protein
MTVARSARCTTPRAIPHQSVGRSRSSRNNFTKRCSSSAKMVRLPASGRASRRWTPRRRKTQRWSFRMPRGHQRPLMATLTLSPATMSAARRSMSCSEVPGPSRLAGSSRLCVKRLRRRCQVAPAAGLPDHLQRQAVPRLNQWGCGPQSHQPCGFQEAADTDGEVPGVTPIFQSGPSVGYPVRLHLPPSHILDGRELPHGERRLRCCGGQPPIQRHPGQTSTVLVHGGGSLRVPDSKDAIPQWRP